MQTWGLGRGGGGEYEWETEASSVGSGSPGHPPLTPSWAGLGGYRTRVTPSLVFWEKPDIWSFICSVFIFNKLHMPNYKCCHLNSAGATIFTASGLQYLFISWNKVTELIKWGQNGHFQNAGREGKNPKNLCADETKRIIASVSGMAAGNSVLWWCLEERRRGY